MSYVQYNKKSYIIKGIGKEHELTPDIKAISGKWNARAKPEPGWIVPIENKVGLDLLISKSQKMESIQTHTRSRKEQHKYHRSISDDEEDEKIISICKEYTSYIESANEEEEEVEEHKEKEKEKKGKKDDMISYLDTQVKALQKQVDEILKILGETDKK